MKRISDRQQSDLVSILATLVTGLDEGEEDQAILNYLDLVGRQALLDDKSSPLEVYAIVRIGDEEDGDRKWIRKGSVTARNAVQAMFYANQSHLGSSRDGMFAVRAADWPEGGGKTPAAVIAGVDLRLLDAQLRTLGAVSDPRTRRVSAKQREHLEGVWHFLGQLHDALETERSANPCAEAKPSGDMLQALRDLAAALELYPHWKPEMAGCLLGIARTAIAKGTGGAS